MSTQFVQWPDFFQAILAYVVSRNIVPAASAFWSSRPDSVILWPSTPPPFIHLTPNTMTPLDWSDGGGRYTTCYTVSITLWIIVENIYDPSFMDTIAFNSADGSTGMWQIQSALLDALTQAYITTPLGNIATITFPIPGQIGPAERFGEANNYLKLPTEFTMEVAVNLPSTNSSGMPD